MNADARPLSGEETSVAKHDLDARPFGFNLIGHLTSNIGLGVVARTIAELVVSHGYPLAIYDCKAGLSREGRETTIAGVSVDALEKLPYSINLIVLGGNSLRTILANEFKFFHRSGYYNVGIPFWELPTFPPQWLPVLDRLDVVVAMSEFIGHLCSFNLSGPLVVSGRVPTEIPSGIVADRAHFKLPKDAVIFVTSFEPHSDSTRKNTRAVVDAFLMDVGMDPRSHLVIKINNPNGIDGKREAIVNELERDLANHKQITLIAESLPYAETLALFNSCDVYVSLHRAEGLGLGMAEAMCLGKPVIATAWSGNMAFMNYLNSCPVSYQLVAVSNDSRSYVRTQLEDSTLWADPNVEDAARCMRIMLEDMQVRLNIGRIAKESMATYNLEARKAHFLAEVSAIHRLRGVVSRKQTASEQRSATLRTSRLARIQELERELRWIKGSTLYRMQSRVKKIVKTFTK